MSIHEMTPTQKGNAYHSKSLHDFFMNSNNVIEFGAAYFSRLSELLSNLDLCVIDKMTKAIISAGDRGKTIYLIGNGGSAASATHFANDLSIGTRAPGSKTFRAVSLSDNTSILTALANDRGYDQVFVHQLDGTLRPNDVVFAFSASGNSNNVIKALIFAKNTNAMTIGCCGFDGGIMKDILDICLYIPSHKDEYGPVEDVFNIIGHLIYSYLRFIRNQ